MEYKASLDTNAILTTIGIGLVLILAAFTCIKLVLNVRNASKKRFTGMMLLYGFILAVIVFMTAKTCLSMPEGYVLGIDQLTIRRPLSDINIPLNEIEKVWVVDPVEEAAIKRIGGSNGFCGYFGRYSDPKAGEMYVYASRKDKWIVIVTKSSGAIAISPDDMGLFDGLNRKIGQKQ